MSLVHQRSVVGASVTADLRDAGSVQTAVQQSEPDLVIHAAFARDEDSIVAATRHVVQAAEQVGADLLFVSSESVFAGDGVGRPEEAPPDPVWPYGRWKTEAEELVVAAVADAPIVRLPLIVSLDPEDHVLSKIRAVGAGGGRSVWFTDEIRQPAWAEDLALGIWSIAGLPPERRAGPWHLPGPERLTRLEIARRAVTAAGLDERWIVGEPSPQDAARPRDLHLTGDRALRELGWSPRPAYRTGLRTRV